MKMDYVIKEYCVYTHRDMDGKIFYVGMGDRRRPFDVSKSHRSEKWVAHVEQYGLGEIDIVDWFSTREEALAHEAEITELLLDMGVKLANTYIGTRISDEAKKKISEANSGENNAMSGEFGSNHPKFKGIWVGIRNRDSAVVAFNGRTDIKNRGYNQGGISTSARGVYNGNKNNYKKFTWYQTTDKEYLRTLINQNNFVDDESKSVLINFIG